VLDAAKSQAKEYNAVADGAKTHIKALMGDAAVGLVPGLDGAGYTRKITKRKGFTVEDTEYVDMRFTKKPKGVSV
jgi:hypothetical protein